MRAAMNLVKRNIYIFIRDRGRVISSVLSMLIVLGLMILFLGDMNSQDIVTALEDESVTFVGAGFYATGQRRGIKVWGCTSV